MFFVFISFICGFIISITAASSWKSFDRLVVNNERFSSPYRTLANASGLRCSTECAEEEDCLGFNHNAVFRSCELIDSWGLRQERHTTLDNVWTVYTKGMSMTELRLWSQIL